MADLSSGGSAKVQLDPGQSLRVEAEGGTTNVTSLYGAPAGTTAVTGSTVFGPYSVPAVLRVACASGAASYATVRDEPPANAFTAAQVAGLQGVVSGYGNAPATLNATTAAAYNGATLSLAAAATLTVHDGAWDLLSAGVVIQVGQGGSATLAFSGTATKENASGTSASSVTLAASGVYALTQSPSGSPKFRLTGGAAL